MTTPDFSQIFQQLDRFHAEVTKVHATLTSPKQRQILGEALEEMKEANAEVQQALPRTIQILKEKADKAKAGADKFEAEKEEREAKRKQAVEQAKAAAEKRAAQKKAVLDSAGKIEKPKLPQVKMPKEWGQQLGSELVERFGRPVPVDIPPAAREGEIWEDWQWDAAK